MKEHYWDEVFANIDDGLLLPALGRAGQSAASNTKPAADGKKSRPTGPIRSGGKLRRSSRTVLIAAVMASLFVGTALAAALWKLSDRLISAEQPTAVEYAAPQRSYLSLAGVSGSNEYHAAREWLQ